MMTTQYMGLMGCTFNLYHSLTQKDFCYDCVPPMKGKIYNRRSFLEFLNAFFVTCLCVLEVSS